MAERYAVANGNWSATATWDGGASLPGAGDDVYANNKTVTIDQNATVLSIRNTAGTTAVAGGSFTLANGVTLTANLIQGTATLLTTNITLGNSGALVGTVTGGAGAGAANYVVSHSSTGTLNITGSCTAGGANNVAVHNNSTGTLNITGNCTGGSGSNAFGAQNSSTGTLNITGNCTGGSGGSSHGAYNNSTGTLNITGNCTGGPSSNVYGASNNSTGTLNVYGEARGTSSNAGTDGVRNNSTGACFVQVAVGNNAPNDSITAGAYGCWQAALGGAITIDAAITGSGGWPGFYGRTFIRNAGTNYYTMRESNAGATLNMGELAADYPTQANVRAGVSFDFGNKTGTCAVPAAGSVAYGVPVDATTGTAALDATAIAAAVLSAAQTTPIHANIKKINSATVYGTGIAGDLWRGSV